MAQQTTTEPMQGDTELEQPIKITWTGYARSRISEYVADYDPANHEGSVMCPERFGKAVNRQKTNLVVRTVEEAEAVRAELQGYDCDQRTWMNGSQDSSLRLVEGKLDAAMEERGYEATGQVTLGMWSFRGYEGEEPEASDSEVAEALVAQRTYRELSQFCQDHTVVGYSGLTKSEKADLILEQEPEAAREWVGAE